MSKYFAYIRVSTTKQGEGVSLEEQRESIKRYASREGLKVIRWFEEKQTAAKRGRPEFSEMIKLLRRERADGVIIHKVDRGARNLKDWAELGELIDQGIDVHFTNESLDLNSRGGRLSADIQAVVAADYIRNLRQEVLKGFYGRLKQGLYPLPAPIGYLNHGGGKPKTIDPKKGPLVRKAFELYATGRYTLKTLATEMEKRGLRTRRGNPVRITGWSAILHNPFYVGIIRIEKRDETFEGIHEPLISKTLFDEVQKVLDGRTNRRKTGSTFLFSRLFRCRHCGYSLIAERQKGHVYYRCHTAGCPTKCIREEALEDPVLETLAPFNFSEEERNQASALLAERRAEWLRSQEKELETLRLQIGKATDRLARLTDAFVDGLIEEQLFLERKEKLLHEREKLRSYVRELEENPGKRFQRMAEFLELAGKAYLGYKLGTKPKKRGLLTKITSNRWVRGENVIVELKKPFHIVAERAISTNGGPYRYRPRTWTGILAALDRFYGNLTTQSKN